MSFSAGITPNFSYTSYAPTSEAHMPPQRPGTGPFNIASGPRAREQDLKRLPRQFHKARRSRQPHDVDRIGGLAGVVVTHIVVKCSGFKRPLVPMLLIESLDALIHKDKHITILAMA